MSPPLRERREDISRLVDHFVRIKGRSLEKSVSGMDTAAIEFLCSLDWPGNVRQLENVIERTIHMSQNNYLNASDVRQACDEDIQAKPDDVRVNKEIQVSPDSKGLAEVEKEMIIHAMNQTQGNLSRTAGALGISRSTLYRKMKKYHISKLVQYGTGCLVLR